MSLPYYKRFPRDFFEGTIGMAFETKCAYGLVLDMIYMRDGQLPDDPRYISGMLGCSVRKWNSIRSELIEAGKLHCENGIISNFRADYLCEERRTYQDKQAENRARPNKINVVKSPPSPPEHHHTEPDTDITTSDEVVRAKPAQPKSSARGTRLPKTWTPTPKDYAFASSEGLTREEINREADRFRDYWIAASGRNATKVDWEATWRNWLRNRRPAGKAVRPQSSGKPQGGGIAAAAMRSLSERYGDRGPVHDGYDGRGDMGAGYVIDGRTGTDG